MSIHKIIFWLLFTFLLRWSSSFACLFTQTWEETFNKSELVVSGKVTAKEKITTSSWGFDPDEQMQFTIYEVNKGSISGNVITLLNRNDSCSASLYSGGYYTLYLYDNSDSKYAPAYGVSMLSVKGRQPPIQSKSSLRTRILNFFTNLF